MADPLTGCEKKKESVVVVVSRYFILPNLSGVWEVVWWMDHGLNEDGKRGKRVKRAG